jgi:hypothetical protein
MTEQRGWRIRQAAQEAAYDFAHKEATRSARKVAKAISHLYGFDQTVYKSTYDAFYRDRFPEELADLLLQEMRVIAQANMTGSRAPVIETDRDLSALFGLDPEAR